jgi:hypothetical protein
MMAYFEYTDKTYGTINLGSYNETKSDCYNESARYLVAMAMDMIYHQHWSNTVMYEYLNSNDNILVIIENLNIPTIEEYFATKELYY